MCQEENCCETLVILSEDHGLLGRLVRLGRIVKLPRLNDVFLVIDNAVAIYIHADLYLVLLAVVYVAGVESEAVLAAEESIDRA